MSFLGLTGNTTNEKKSSAHVEAEIGELSEAIKRKIDIAIFSYEEGDYAVSKRLIKSLPKKIINSKTIQKLLCCMG